MDMFNVTGQYTGLTDCDKKTLQEAKKCQAQQPCDRKSRDHAYRKFIAALKFERIGGPRMVYSSFIPPAYILCTSPISALKYVAIKDLQLETHHRGTYLMQQSIMPLSQMIAIIAIMKDENGNVMMLQLYQQKDKGKLAVANIVNVGTILLVKI